MPKQPGCTWDAVEGEDLVHKCSGEDDLVEHRNAASHQPRVSTLRAHGQVPLIAVSVSQSTKRGSFIQQNNNIYIVWGRHYQTISVSHQFIIVSHQSNSESTQTNSLIILDWKYVRNWPVWKVSTRSMQKVYSCKCFPSRHWKVKFYCTLPIPNPRRWKWLGKSCYKRHYLLPDEC